MARRIADEAYVKELEQLIQRFDEASSQKEADSAAVELAQNLLRIYVKSGESMAALREDLLNEIQFQLKSFKAQQADREEVYGLDTASPGFPKHAEALRTLAADAFSRFKLEIDRLEREFANLNEQTQRHLGKISNERALLKSTTERFQTLLHAQSVSPGHPVDSGPAEEAHLARLLTEDLNSRIGWYRSLLDNGGQATVFSKGQPAGKGSSDAVIAIDPFASPVSLKAFEAEVDAGVKHMVIELCGSMVTSGCQVSFAWAMQWLTARGFSIERFIESDPLVPELGLAPLEVDQRQPAFVLNFASQINALVSQLNHKLFGGRRQVIVAVRK